MSESESLMVSKCANPKCTARLKYLHEGRLFVVQTRASVRYWGEASDSFSAPPGKQIEYYWLCDACADQMKIDAQGTLRHLPAIPKLNHPEVFGRAIC